MFVIRRSELFLAIGFVLFLGVASCGDASERVDREGLGTSVAAETLPPINDYGDEGPFRTRTIRNTGPLSRYTMYLPRDLGEDGFLHPIASWGNGIFTDPSWYDELLSTIASHGIVIIAANSSTVTDDLMEDGLDWLIEQNGPLGRFSGQLDTSRAIAIGYSLGGGAAVDIGDHPAVIATISFHGLTGAAERLHGPLLLFTGTSDGIVPSGTYVDRTFERSTVQTAYAKLRGAGHLYPLGDAGDERAPTIAWIRLWAYNDQGAKVYFYGSDCVLCRYPWTDYKQKNWPN